MTEKRIRWRVLRSTLLVCAATAGFGQAWAQDVGIDSAQAKQYLEEAQRACEKDAGRLWGKSLCAPILLVDPGTRAIAANRPDGEGQLKQQDGIYIGALPQQVNIANTATTWAGEKWTMLRWPLPASPAGRTRLMMHELFHRLQDDLGLKASNPANTHLDSLEGRVWLQLEWRALRQALARFGAPAEQRKQAVEDVLLFRMQRRAHFPKAEVEERELEMNEGLAEYTGYKLRGTPDGATAEAVIGRLGTAVDEPSFVRSFAYASGPGYGLLLDRAGRDWRRGLTPKSDFGSLLQGAYGVRLPRDLASAANLRAAEYDSETLRWLETRRESNRQARVAAYRKRFVEGPVLLLPVLSKFNFTYDPNTVMTMDENRTVYPELRVTDEWGILEVSDGAVLVRESGLITKVVVEAPKSNVGQPDAVEGNGWKLTLAEGWKLAAVERAGDFQVARKE